MVSTIYCCKDNNELLFPMNQVQFSLGEISALLHPYYEEIHSKCREGGLLPILQGLQERSSHIGNRAERINPIMLLLYGTGYSSLT